MTRNEADQLTVWLDDPAYGPRQIIGSLSRVSDQLVSFAYSQTWLDHASRFPIDPQLDLHPGQYYPHDSYFGVFMDSCPDRWGQVLMNRRELIEAKDEERKPRTLNAWDFLLGVQDYARMGALRFSLSEDSPFLADEALAAPPITSIAELESIAYEISRPDQNDIDALRRWLKVLVAPGASLGGARPKANITEADGTLWIAKFPSANDEYDVALWEMLLHSLAGQCGIKVPEAKLMRFGRHHTFLVKRFDRDGQERRFFASAMTVLERTDRDGASYLELAEFIATSGVGDAIADDLRELFTRIAFNIAVANRDDHLRNHGFFRQPDGWRLSPAYDINPSFKKTEHVLSIDMHDNRGSLDTLLSTCDLYRLSQSEGRDIVDHVCEVIATWQQKASRMGISKFDRLRAEGLFQLNI